MTLIKCETCINGLLPSGHQCPACDGTAQVECEHGDVCQDERVCLICSQDMSENIMNAAHERMEGDR